LDGGQPQSRDLPVQPVYLGLRLGFEYILEFNLLFAKLAKDGETVCSLDVSGVELRGQIAIPFRACEREYL